MGAARGGRHAGGDKAEAFATQDIRDQLARVLSSESFAGKKRLQDLLRFVVEETLKGRETELKGYTIGYEVFRLGSEFDPQTNSIVRVAVTRLRTALGDYYQAMGATDPIRISLPVGSYAPTFSSRPRMRRALDPETEGLYSDANALVNPPSSKARLLAGRKLFEFLAEVEPNFPGGFAGAALTYCHAVLFGHSNQRREDLQEAVRLASQAIAVEDTFAVAHAVLGLALALLGDRGGGLREADLGIELDPTNPWVQIWRALICCIVGDPKEAIRSGKQAVGLEKDDARSPCLNVLGMAFLFDGQPQRARNLFVKNIEKKGPDGPHMAALRSIAFAETAHHQAVCNELARIRREWPDYSIRQWLSNFSGAKELKARWLAMLGDLGWSEH